jgi:integrase
LRGDYFKPLHNLPVDQVERRDVAAALLAITRRSSGVTAALARNALSAFYVWVLAQGLATVNPVVGTVQTPLGPSRERVLSNPELASVWRACDDVGEFGSIVKLLILTGARRSEIGGLCWSELDLDRGVWTLPRERSKNKHSHALPLIGTAMDIVSAVPQRAGRDQLFGERGPLGFTAWDKFKRLLDAKAGVVDWNLHDLRRTVATRMADIGIQPHIIEQILNHQSGHKRGPAGIYNRSSYEREVRVALALWEQHLSTLVNSGAETKSKVVNFPALEA